MGGKGRQAGSERVPFALGGDFGEVDCVAQPEGGGYGRDVQHPPEGGEELEAVHRYLHKRLPRV